MKLRIATFNLENWDDVAGRLPTLDTRIAVVRPMLLRVNADILCLQEVNGQGSPRELAALRRLFENTPYTNFEIATTLTADGDPFAERNLVVASRFPIAGSRQFKHEFAPAPQYRKVTSVPPETAARDVEWERAAFYTRIEAAPDNVIHVVNLHLKSRIPSDIAGQQINSNTWRSISGFAEGFFVSSMKRVGQALEVRMFVDTLFDADPEARVVVCGDFNADLNDVPLAAIRGDVEDTGNGDLAGRVMLPCERTVPESTRFTLYHQGRPNMLDHILLSRPMLPFYRRTEIHNELLHDESIAFAVDTKFPEPDHAPVIAEFEFPDA